MDVRIKNHSAQPQKPLGLCTLPPGLCQVSPQMFVAIEGDEAFKDGRLEVIAQDAAELKKIREAIEAKAKQSGGIGASTLKSTENPFKAAGVKPEISMPASGRPGGAKPSKEPKK